jgi:DNA-binding response OmpR family regulator
MDKQEKKIKVLVVDDEEIVRESLQEWLGAYGFDVSTAEDGMQALGLIHDQEFDVVILDIGLPDMEGTEVLKEAREFRPELKAIILTAYPSKKTTIEAVKLGAAEYLVKPFEPEHLVGIINAILSGVLPEIGNDFALVGPLYQLVSEWKKQQSDKP